VPNVGEINVFEGNGKWKYGCGWECGVGRATWQTLQQKHQLSGETARRISRYSRIEVSKLRREYSKLFFG
jgi:hypothetical protein